MRDLFGGEAARAGRQRPARASGAAKRVVASQRVEPVTQARLPASAVESFGALRAAVCLSSAAIGTVWLVPAERAPDPPATDLTRLVTTVRMFPGARVARFESLHINMPTVASAHAPTNSLASPDARNE
jgi:hypothetical protein